MKKTTKAIIFSVALIPIFMLVFSFTNPTSEIKYATMRTIESGQPNWSKIVLIYEGKTEELELNSQSKNSMTSNTSQINQGLNLLASKGYRLVSQSGGDVITMYSFIKE